MKLKTFIVQASLTIITYNRKNMFIVQATGRPGNPPGYTRYFTTFFFVTYKLNKLLMFKCSNIFNEKGFKELTPGPVL